MSTTLDLDAIYTIRPSHNEYGPSDTSDSASDVVGTVAEESDSDSTGTGDRASVEFVAPSETENDLAPDISPDQIVHSLSGARLSAGEDDEAMEEIERDIGDAESGDDMDLAR